MIGQLIVFGVLLSANSEPATVTRIECGRPSLIRFINRSPRGYLKPCLPAPIPDRARSSRGRSAGSVCSSVSPS